MSNQANDNTGIGNQALHQNTTGNGNTANGAFALFTNTEGSSNTAVGYQALANNTPSGSFNDASFNTAIGYQALLSNTTGAGNVGIGAGTLGNVTTGGQNVAIGENAGRNQTTGIRNVYVGDSVGYNQTTGNYNVYIGWGINGISGENYTIHIGDNLPTGQGQSACYIGGIGGQAIDPATATQVGIDATGKLGTTVSSQRFKRDIKPMENASGAILSLKPVTFHYKSDPKNTPCFGLIAEEVENVSPALVVHDKDGQPYSVRYDQVNAMLLNEFLKEHRRVQELEATVAHQQKNFESRMAQQEKQIESLTANLQRVSAQVEISRPASRIVLKNQ